MLAVSVATVNVTGDDVTVLDVVGMPNTVLVVVLVDEVSALAVNDTPLITLVKVLLAELTLTPSMVAVALLAVCVRVALLMPLDGS